MIGEGEGLWGQTAISVKVNRDNSPARIGKRAGLFGVRQAEGSLAKIT
jgi:hypothetical protein